jgi:hypothetical protein
MSDRAAVGKAFDVQSYRHARMVVLLRKPLHHYIAAPPEGRAAIASTARPFYRRDLKGRAVEIPPFSAYRNAAPPAPSN